MEYSGRLHCLCLYFCYGKCGECWDWFRTTFHVLCRCYKILASQVVNRNQWTGGVELLVWCTERTADPGIVGNQGAAHSFIVCTKSREVDTPAMYGSPAAASPIRSGEWFSSSISSQEPHGGGSRDISFAEGWVWPVRDFAILVGALCHLPFLSAAVETSRYSSSLVSVPNPILLGLECARFSRGSYLLDCNLWLFLSSCVPSQSMVLS